MSVTPARMNTARMMIAPRMPQNRILCWYRGGSSEICKDNDEHENVVDAEGLFNQVTGQEFEGIIDPHEIIDAEVEPEGEHDPENRPEEGFFYEYVMLPSLENFQVQGPALRQ